MHRPTPASLGETPLGAFTGAFALVVHHYKADDHLVIVSAFSDGDLCEEGLQLRPVLPPVYDVLPAAFEVPAQLTSGAGDVLDTTAMVTINEDTWTGFFCECTGHRLLALDLKERGLVGPRPGRRRRLPLILRHERRVVTLRHPPGHPRGTPTRQTGPPRRGCPRNPSRPRRASTRTWRGSAPRGSDGRGARTPGARATRGLGEASGAQRLARVERELPAVVRVRRVHDGRGLA